MKTKVQNTKVTKQDKLWSPGLKNCDCLHPNSKCRPCTVLRGPFSLCILFLQPVNQGTNTKWQSIKILLVLCPKDSKVLSYIQISMLSLKKLNVFKSGTNQSFTSISRQLAGTEDSLHMTLNLGFNTKGHIFCIYETRDISILGPGNEKNLVMFDKHTNKK